MTKEYKKSINLDGMTTALIIEEDGAFTVFKPPINSVVAEVKIYNNIDDLNYNIGGEIVPCHPFEFNGMLYNIWGFTDESYRA